MLLGCSVLPDEIPLAAALGWNYVEMAGKQVAAMSDSTFERTLRALRDCRISCLALNAYCPPDIIIAGPAFDVRKAYEYAHSMAFRAKAMGVERIGIGSPNSRILPAGYPHKRAWQEAIDFVHATQDGLDGIEVCVEALGSYFCNFLTTISQSAALASEAGCGLILDFYQMELEGEADICLEPYLGIIRHAHLSDDDGLPTLRAPLDAAKRALHQARIRRLRDTGYGGCLSLETDIPLDIKRMEQTLIMMHEALNK